MQLAPIVLFVYNRPWHTAQTLQALSANRGANESLLYIYADGPKPGATAETLENIQRTRQIIKSQNWCRQLFVIESNVNKGLANSIIQGVTDIINKHGKIIVVEDDLVTHPFFITYMNEYLRIYENSESVISIHGFMYPVKNKITSPFFLKGADCWGWATWKRGWDLFEYDAKLLLDKLVEKKLTKEFNFNNTYDYISLLKSQINGTVDSWAIRWYASAFLLDKLTLYPPVSLVQNIGMDGTGTHKDDIGSQSIAEFASVAFELKEIAPVADKKNKRQIEAYFKGDRQMLKRLIEKVRLLYKPIFKNV